MQGVSYGWEGGEAESENPGFSVTVQKNGMRTDKISDSGELRVSTMKMC